MPNPTAQALGSGRTRTIALLVPDITNPYFSGVIKGAERAAAAAGLTLVLGDTAENPTAEAELVRRLERAVDGFVISASRLTDDELRAAAERSPIALVNRATAGTRLRGGRLRLRDPADRGPPGVVRPPVVRLRRRPGGVVVGCPSLAGAAGGGRRAGDADAQVRPLHADARRRAGRRRRRGRVGRHRGGVPQRHAGHRRACAGWPSGATACPTTSAWSGSTTCSAPSSANPTLTTLAERTADAGARAVEVLVQQLPQRSRGRGPDAGAAHAPGRARLDRSGARSSGDRTPGARRQCPADGRPTPSRVSRAARRGSRLSEFPRATGT